MRRSAGLLLYRHRGGDLEVFLVHPGGPFWRNKDDGAWQIPKGEIAEGEEPLACARREFEEETGFPAEGEFAPLGEFKQPGGKYVQVWALKGDCDPERLVSNDFEMEWPPRSGRKQRFPDLDRAAWFGIEQAREKLLAGQRPILDRLLKMCRCEL